MVAYLIFRLESTALGPCQEYSQRLCLTFWLPLKTFHMDFIDPASELKVLETIKMTAFSVDIDVQHVHNGTLNSMVILLFAIIFNLQPRKLLSQNSEQCQQELFQRTRLITEY